MSISGQQTINIGLPNESTNSDSLYTAFTTTQQNFTQLFSCASPFINFVGGTGISASSNATIGTVTITNAGVTNIVAGTNITINRSNGNVTISSTGGGGGGGGTVTSVGLSPVSTSRIVVTDSPVVSSGVIGIDLATSGATAGTYTNPNVTVDTYGRVTSISSGPASGTVTSVGLTAGPGVQINGGPITSSGSIVVTNTGVIKLTSGTGINLSGQTGNITVSLDGSYQGTVTSVGIYSTSLTITGSPITTNGTIGIELPTNPSAAGTFTAGNLTTTGTLSVTGDSTFGNIQSSTSVVTGNVSAGNIFANSGTISAALLTGTITTAAQPNITSVGTLGSLVVTANITGGNANLGNNVAANFFTGSGQYLTAIQAANIAGTVAAASNATRVSTTLQTTGTYYVPFISATSGANYALNSNAAFSANLANGAIIATTHVGNLSGTGNSNVGNLGFGTGAIIGTGNITAGNIIGTIAAGSNTITTTGNANVGNLGTSQVLATANVTTPQLISNVITGTAPLVVASTTRVTNLNVAYANVADYSNIAAAGGGTYYPVFVGTSGSGNFALASNAAFSFNASTGNLSVTLLNVTSNANVGNLGFGSGVITGTGNITGGNIIGIIAAGSNTITTTGNITGGNIIGIVAAGANAISTTGNITGGNIIGIVAAGANAISTTGNITGGNIIGIVAAGANAISTTGNISGGNVVVTSYNIRSINAAVSAAGTNQAGATALTKEINVVSTVASGAGVKLPTAVAGMVIIINNTSANTLNVYPATGGAINNASADAAYTHVSGASLQYYATSATQWYTVGASYA